MPESPLHGHDVTPGRDQPTGEVVPQAVDVHARHAGDFDGPLPPSTVNSWWQRAPVGGEEDPPLRRDAEPLDLRGEQLHQRLRQIQDPLGPILRGAQLGGATHPALHLATHLKGAPEKVDVLALDGRRLAQAEPRKRAQRDEGPHPRLRRCVEPGDLAVSYTHLRAHETDSYLVCRLLL